MCLTHLGDIRNTKSFYSQLKMRFRLGSKSIHKFYAVKPYCIELDQDLDLGFCEQEIADWLSNSAVVSFPVFISKSAITSSKFSS
jgi:hypothetical protein